MYEVAVPQSVVKQINKLPHQVRERVLMKLTELEESPRPLDCRKLETEESLYRLRVGDYRIIYAVDDTNKKVVISRVAHRREVYRRRP
jgi:mRNA interferase RelE/StbE